MLIREVMNKNVITAEPEISIREAARVMVDNRVGSLVVLKNGKVVGMLTDRDVLVAFSKGDIDYDSTPIDQIMAHYIYTVSPDMKLETAENMMVQNKVKKLPVIENDRLVGIITSTDIAVAQSEVVETIGRLLSKKVKRPEGKDQNRF